jgi:hypothetical protein
MDDAPIFPLAPNVNVRTDRVFIKDEADGQKYHACYPDASREPLPKAHATAQTNTPKPAAIASQPVPVRFPDPSVSEIPDTTEASEDVERPESPSEVLEASMEASGKPVVESTGIWAGIPFDGINGFKGEAEPTAVNGSDGDNPSCEDTMLAQFVGLFPADAGAQEAAIFDMDSSGV